MFHATFRGPRCPQARASSILDQAGKTLARERLEDFDREKLLDFARTKLTPQDRVALEATTNTWAVARLLRPFVADVVASS